MKVSVKPEYQVGEQYLLTLVSVQQFADYMYGTQDLAPKFRLVWEGEHGKINELMNVSLDDGEPAIRPSSPFGQRLAALGVDWSDVGELVIRPTKKNIADALGDAWDAFPRLSDMKQEGFVPIEATVLHNGRKLNGGRVLALFGKDRRGWPTPSVFSRAPEQ